MNENRINRWTPVIVIAVIIIIILCTAVPDISTLMMMLLVLVVLAVLILLFRWGAVTGAKASGSQAAVNALRIKRAVIIAVITIITVYTAVQVTENKAGRYYELYHNEFLYDQYLQNNFWSWLPVFIVVPALAIYALYALISGYVKKKKETEARQLEELMDTPLEKFSDKEDKAEKLADNYDGDPGNDITL